MSAYGVVVVAVVVVLAAAQTCACAVPCTAGWPAPAAHAHAAPSACVVLHVPASRAVLELLLAFGAAAVVPAPVAGPVGPIVLGAPAVGGAVVDGLVTGGGLAGFDPGALCAIANGAAKARLAANTPATNNAFM